MFYVICFTGKLMIMYALYIYIYIYIYNYFYFLFYYIINKNVSFLRKKKVKNI